MTVLQEWRRGMHRHSDEDVAAVVLAAVTELRARRDPAAPSRWDAVAPELRRTAIARVRLIRLGRMPREQYEEQAGPDDPPYPALPASRRDEDQLTWLVTQALTGD